MDLTVTMLNRVFGGLVFAFGLILGSFLNVCIYRMPRGLSVVRPRSACPNCGKQIAAYDNVPVLSWLWLRGRCRHCHTRITPRYMVVELMLGLLFLACFAEFGLQTETLKWCSFSFLLLGLIFTDAETHLLPDLLTLPGVAMGLAWSLVTVVPGPLGFYFDRRLPVPLLSFGDALIGAAVGGGFIYGTAAIYLRLRGAEGMGIGRRQANGDGRGIHGRVQHGVCVGHGVLAWRSLRRADRPQYFSQASMALPSRPWLKPSGSSRLAVGFVKPALLRDALWGAPGVNVTAFPVCR